MEPVIKFLSKFQSFLTLDEFKDHVNFYIEMGSASNIHDALLDGFTILGNYVFLNKWQTRYHHLNIIIIVYNISAYYIKFDKLPDSALQALADCSRVYMDTEIIRKICAVAQTWD